MSAGTNTTGKVAAAALTEEVPDGGGGQPKEVAKEDANPLEQIERLLTCPICLDRFKQPRLLACQHTFCLPCLENYVESAGGRPRIRCPECRAEHALALDGGVQALPTNLTLMAFLEIHMEASAANATEMQAYVQRFNMERCRVCEEKAELELCAHCDRKCCAECRTAHVDMLRRDLSRLLGQVRRLSQRVKEASEGLGRGLEQLQANGEQTRQEVRDYFNRYQRELKRREENFMDQVEIFVQNEDRQMRTLRDALDVEWNNLQDGCLWVDAVLTGQRAARDDELARFKIEFQQGLDYLRSFQPDSEEMFAKKLRFSPGDDAAKLPTAIANFGELTVSLPQFANRYLPVEQQYLPRPFRMNLESENFARREKDREIRLGLRAAEETLGLGLGHQPQQRERESEGAKRWRRRRELEEEAWVRLRATDSVPWTSAASSRANSGAVSPMPLAVDGIGIGLGGLSPPASGESKLGTATGLSPIGSGRNIEMMERKEEEQQEKRRGDLAMRGEAEQTEQQKGKEEKRTKEDTRPKGPTAGGTTKAPGPAGTQSLRRPSGGTMAAGQSTSGTKTTAAQQQTKTEGTRIAAQPGTGRTVGGGGKTEENSQKPGMGPKNVQAEGPAQRGRLLMVNGPRAGTAVAPRRANLNSPAKGQKPPLPVRQLSAGNEPKAEGKRRKSNGEDEEEEEEEEWDRGRAQNGRGTTIQSQCHRFRIHCRSSSHGRAKPASSGQQGRRPSVEAGGQPIPVVGQPSAALRPFPLPTFFPTKTTGEWAEGPPSGLGLLLSRSRTNPDLFAAATADLEITKNSSSRTTAPRRRDSLLRGQQGAGESAAEKRSRLEGEEGKRTISSQSTEGGHDKEPEGHGGMDFQRRPRLVLGGRGMADGQMNWPRGICALPTLCGQSQDQLLFAVADSSNHRVQVFSVLEGSLLHSFGSFGTGDGQFDGCCSVCPHPSRKELLVADRYNHRVQVFDLRGRFVRKFGCRGAGDGQFQHCWGIAVDDQLGLVYVADKDNHRVQMFDSEGAFLTKFGSMGDGPRQFNHPLYLAFHSPSRLLYVSDSANNRVSIFSPDGLPVSQFQGPAGGPPECQLKLPRGIALDERGSLVVADSGNNRIQVFSAPGECVRQFGTWGAAPGQFKGVEGICLLPGLGPELQLAVADRENNRVQLFCTAAG